MIGAVRNDGLLPPERIMLLVTPPDSTICEPVKAVAPLAMP